MVSMVFNDTTLCDTCSHCMFDLRYFNHVLLFSALLVSISNYQEYENVKQKTQNIRIDICWQIRRNNKLSSVACVLMYNLRKRVKISKAWRAWVRSLNYLTAHAILSPIRRVFLPGFVNYKKGVLDSQPQVIKFTSCLSMVGGSLRLLPPLKLVAMI